MSFIHDTLVGHFNPATLLPGRPWQAVRPLDIAVLESLLSECSPEVRDQVELRDGFVVVHWDALKGKKLREEASQFAYRLAEQQQCIAAEGPLYWIAYPEWAREVQNRSGASLKKATEGQRAGPSMNPKE
jgi:hypothetical protein